MRRSSFLPIAILAILLAGGCASHQPAHPPPVMLTRGSLAIASGLKTVSVALPAGFAADPAYAPVWLRQGAEIGVAGNANGTAQMVGLSGPGYTNQRILAANFGVAAPHGKLLDVAPSPDGFALATVVAEAGPDRVAVLLRDVLGAGDVYPLATLDGAFAAAQLTWIDPFTLVLALQPAPSNGPDVLDIAGARSALYVITASSPPGMRQLARIGCDARQLTFSPSGQMTVTEGGGEESAALINLDDETCRKLGVHDPFHVLAWAPDSSAFLYAALGENAVPGIFRYDLGSGRSVVVAIASGAAAYASDGTIVALGDSWLTWRRAAASPDKPLNVQVALWRLGAQEITINSIGIATTAAMLAQSRMIFSRVSDDGVIDVVARSGEGPRRELIEYSYPARAAFPLATSAIDAPLAISWSPDGKAIAIVDRGAQPNLLTVITPPR